MLAASWAEFSTSQLAFGAAFLFLAGLLRGFTGYGFSIAAVPLLSLIVPPATAVPIVLVLQLLIGANGIGEGIRLCDRRSIGLLAAAAALVTPVGVLLLTQLPPNTVRLCIAAIVAVAVVVLAGGIGPRGNGGGVTPPPWTSAPATLLFGGMSGLFNGLAGMPGPPVIAYYLGSGVAKESARASMVILFSLTSIAALVPLAIAGTLTVASGILALAALPLVWVGSSIGGALFRRSSEATYRRTGIVVLSATALLTAAKAISALA